MHVKVAADGARQVEGAFQRAAHDCAVGRTDLHRLNVHRILDAVGHGHSVATGRQRNAALPGPSVARVARACRQVRRTQHRVRCLFLAAEVEARGQQRALVVGHPKRHRRRVRLDERHGRGDSGRYRQPLHVLAAGVAQLDAIGSGRKLQLEAAVGLGLRHAHEAPTRVVGLDQRPCRTFRQRPAHLTGAHLAKLPGPARDLLEGSRGHQQAAAVFHRATGGRHQRRAAGELLCRTAQTDDEAHVELRFLTSKSIGNPRARPREPVHLGAACGLHESEVGREGEPAEPAQAIGDAQLHHVLPDVAHARGDLQAAGFRARGEDVRYTQAPIDADALHPELGAAGGALGDGATEGEQRRPAS